MDGYSIQEAAEVLGVPKRRIRELVERGVIQGSDEGDGGLRVYLQPRPPASFERQLEREPGGEASPFRELLNEFRNLTERYGQALLALGESRGEVAALRGRVEALETRMDLRLGTSAGPSVVEWHAPPPAFEAETLADLAPSDSQADAAPTVEAVPEPVAVPAVSEEPRTDAGEATPPVEEPLAAAEPQVSRPEAEAEIRQRPRRGISAIVAGGIAEALARAVDPSTGELPPPADVLGEASSEPEAETDVAAAEPEEAADEELVAAASDFPIEPEEVTDEQLVAMGPEVDQSVYSAEIEEPDWLAEGEYTWLDAAQAEQRDEVASEEVEPSLEAEPEAEIPLAAAGDEQVEPSAEPEQELVAETASYEEAAEETSEPWAAVGEFAEARDQVEPEEQAEAVEQAESVEEAEFEEEEAEPQIEHIPGEQAAEATEHVAAEQATDEWQPDESFDENPDAVAPVSGELPEDDFGQIPEAAITEVLVAEEHIFEPSPAVDVVEVADELEFEAPPSDAQAPAATTQVPERPPQPPASEPAPSAPPAASGEVPLMWLGGEYEDREEYAAEIEVGTAGWQTAIPRAVAGEQHDELTRIAQDQGWDANEVEAIRSLLEPPPAEEQTAPEPDDVPVVGAVDSDEAETEAESSSSSEMPHAPAPPRWPAEDRTVSFTLPGGDELRRALDALGMPASEQEREQAMAAQRAQWARTSPPRGDATRALLRPDQGPDSRAAEPSPPRQPTEFSPEDHGPAGEPEWLRGRRDPAARAYRRLRRIFPS